MTSNYKDFKPLPVNKKVKIKIIDHEKDCDLKVIIDRYKILFNSQTWNCCNWPYAIIKRKKVMGLWDKKTFNVGYVKDIRLDFGKDIIEQKKLFQYKIVEEKVLEDKWWNYEQKYTDNVFTVNLNKNTKLLFFNGNNNGFYNYDFLIYEDEKLLFKSSL